jgi:FkbH-like protein|tara:strand:+ start:275 stop:2029 length:1755 start_codon:yes stop_codon:yes gene_type:complete
LKNEEKLSYFLNHAKMIKTDKINKKIRVAVLGSFTLNGFDETIRVKCYEKNIECKTYVGDYNQYNQDILNNDSKFYQFNPEITFLILDVRHVIGELFFVPYSLTSLEKEEFVNQKIKEITNLINTIINNSQSHLILTELQIPTYSPYGINEKNEEFGLKQMIQKINDGIRNETRDEQLVSILDFNEFIQRYGETNVFSYKQFFSGDMKIAIEFIPKFVDELMRFIIAISGMAKKCIVLDLDNTLWGGVVGEDGFDNIKLGEEPVGRSYVEFQKRLLGLNQRGIILAINSKNNFDDAIRVIKDHPNMVLKEENFSCMKINWKDKVSNLHEISKELNIGLDSLVFFDDDPVNREFVKEQLKEVLVVDLPTDSSEYPQILTEMNVFESGKITEEDVKRREIYSEQQKRIKFESDIGNFDEFLKQMNIQVEIKKADSFSIPRISQLTLKTNQFNLTTKRYQENEISSLANNKDRIVECAKVSDKFGDNGITGVYIVEKNDNEWIIDSFLLSCRIIGRGVENVMINQLIERAKKEDVKRIKGKFISTHKNKPAENFYKEFGFIEEGDFWVFNTDNTMKKIEHIKVIENE